MRSFTPILAVATIAFFTANVSAYGAHLQDCQGLNEGFYEGDQGCQYWGDEDGLQLLLTQSSCKGKSCIICLQRESFE